MKKTEMQIERDFYSMIKSSELGKAIKGGIYRSGMRPNDAKTEDLIVKFLSGLDGQIQVGVVILNLYVPDIPNGSDGRLVADKNRIGVLQDLILSFIEENPNTEYLLESDETPTARLNEEIEQHFIYARIMFNRLTE